MSKKTEEPKWSVVRVRREDWKILRRLAMASDTSIVGAFAALVKDADERRAAERKRLKEWSEVL